MMYKYYPGDEKLAVSVLIDRTVKFTEPSQFNDPFECNPHFVQVTDTELEVYCQRVLLHLYPNIDPLQLALEAKAFKFKMRILEKDILSDAKKTIKNVGVASFTTRSDSILMWSHYAFGHKGFCVEYTVPESVTDDFGHMLAVQYYDDYPKIKSLDYFKLQDYVHYGLWKTEYNEIQDLFTLSAFLSKGKDWEYESEVRCIKSPQRGGAGFHPISPAGIKGVILGSRMEKSIKSKISSMVKSKLPHAYIKNAVVSDTSFHVYVS